MDKGLLPLKHPRENEKFDKMSISRVGYKTGSMETLWLIDDEDMQKLLDNRGVVELRIYANTAHDGGHPVISIRVPEKSEPTMQELYQQAEDEPGCTFIRQDRVI